MKIYDITLPGRGNVSPTGKKGSGEPFGLVKTSFLLRGPTRSPSTQKLIKLTLINFLKGGKGIGCNGRGRPFSTLRKKSLKIVLRRKRTASLGGSPAAPKKVLEGEQLKKEDLESLLAN